MGHSKLLFVGSGEQRDVDEEFICVMCHDVLENPTILHPCQHAACRTCVEDMIIKTRKGNSPPSCPMLGCGTRTTAQMQPLRLFTRLLNKIKMKCPHTLLGCHLITTVGELRDHDEECGFNPENQKHCDRGCGAVLRLKIRRSGEHNCVEYLKGQLDKAKKELDKVKQELKNANKEQFLGRFGLMLKREAGDDPPGPSPPKRAKFPTIACVQKWGFLDKDEDEQWWKMTARAIKFHAGWTRYSLNYWVDQIENTDARVRGILPKSLSLVSITWSMWDSPKWPDPVPGLNDPKEEDGHEFVEGMVEPPNLGMEFKVDEIFRVKVVLHQKEMVNQQ